MDESYHPLWETKFEKSFQLNNDKINQYKVIDLIYEDKRFLVLNVVDNNNQEFRLKLFKFQIFNEDNIQYHPEQLQEYNKIKQEINNLQRIESNYVIKFIESFQYQGHTVIVFENVSLENLKDFIDKNPFKSQKEIIDMFQQIVQGYSDILMQGIIHRKLKMKHIYFKDRDIKISGFGFSHIIDQSIIRKKNKYGKTEQNITSQQKQQILRSESLKVFDEEVYTPPEITIGFIYNYKVDMWNLGVILFYMIYGCFPFSKKKYFKDQNNHYYEYCSPKLDLNKVLQRLGHRAREWKEEIQQPLQDVLEQLLTYDPQKRMDIQKLQYHDIFSSLKSVEMPNLENSNFSMSTLEQNLTITLPGITDLSTEDHDINKEQQILSKLQSQSTFMLQSKGLSNSLGSQIIGFKLRNKLISTNSKEKLAISIYQYQFFRVSLLMNIRQFFNTNSKNVSRKHYQILDFYILKAIIFQLEYLKKVFDHNLNQFNVFMTTEEVAYLKDLEQIEDKDHFQQKIKELKRDGKISEHQQEFQNFTKSKIYQNFQEQTNSLHAKYKTLYQQRVDYIKKEQQTFQYYYKKDITQAVDSSFDFVTLKVKNFGMLPNDIKYPLKLICLVIYADVYKQATDYAKIHAEELQKIKVKFQANSVDYKKWKLIKDQEFEENVHLKFQISHLLIILSVYSKIFKISELSINTSLGLMGREGFKKYILESSVKQVQDELKFLFKNYLQTKQNNFTLDNMHNLIDEAALF